MNFRISIRWQEKALCACLVLGIISAIPADGLDPQKRISQFTHTSWTAKDGLPGPVRAIAQTPDGYLWLGTQAGLYRFDGLRFVAWQPSFGEQSIESPVWSLCTAKDGTLWIGFASGGVGQLRDGHFKSYSHIDGLPQGGILSLVEDANGRIWAGGAYGLSKLQGGTWQPVGAESGYPAPGVQTMLVDRYGTLWVATDHFDFRLSKDSVRPNTILTLAPNAKRFAGTGQAVGMIWSISASPKGSVWLVHTSRDVVFVANQAGPKTSIPVASPTCLLFDGDDSAWIGLYGSGVRRLNHLGIHSDSALDQFQASDGLSNDVVYSTFKDREGNLWFGTDGGLDRFRDNKATPFSAKEGLIPDNQIAITSTGDGSVWFVSGAGRGERLRAGSFVSWKLPPFPRPEQMTILSLYGDEKDHLWVGGAFKLAEAVDGRFSYSNVPNVDEASDVQAIARDARGNFWITVWDDAGGGILRLRDGKWSNFPSRSVHLPQYRCRVLYGDPQGRVWFGFEDGEVAVYENEAFHLYSSKDGLTDGRIFAITIDRAGHIWVSGESGLSRFNQGHFATLTKENGLPGNSISGIVEDDDGFLWLAGALAILRVSPLELEKALRSSSYRIQGDSFDASDGFRELPRQGGPFPTATKAADGRLWFSTTAGVAVIDPRHLPKNILPPPVTIESLRADNQILTAVSGLRLQPRTKNLQFEYAALSLTDPARVRFRYKLEGYDDDWRGPVTAREVAYTNLPPRNYRFRVIACNNDGVWNEAGGSLDFSILPAFYQTTWFLLLCGAATGCLALAAYKWRIRQVAASLDLKFKERLSERARIAGEIHDTLLQSFQGFILHFQKARNLLPGRSAEAIQILDRGLEGVEQAIVEGRDAIYDIRSPARAAGNLPGEITSLSEELIGNNGKGNSPQFQLLIEGSVQALQPDLHVEIFRIAREALRNAVSHAQASRIEAEIAYDESLFRLRIRDDGKGIDQRIAHEGGPKGHWGLRGMHERAQRIGGRLKVWSEPGAGTEVELRVSGSIVYRVSPDRAKFHLFRQKDKQS